MPGRGRNVHAGGGDPQGVRPKPLRCLLLTRFARMSALRGESGLDMLTLSSSAPDCNHVNFEQGQARQGARGRDNRGPAALAASAWDIGGLAVGPCFSAARRLLRAGTFGAPPLARLPLPHATHDVQLVKRRRLLASKDANHLVFGKDSPCTRSVERFGDIIAQSTPRRATPSIWANLSVRKRQSLRRWI
jgi:hypothetical protein